MRPVARQPRHREPGTSPLYRGSLDKTAEDIFNELRVASKGGTADYYGITYEKIEQTMGVFWPCPELDHPGTPRLFEDRKFFTPDKKAHFNAVEFRPPRFRMRSILSS